MALPAAFSEANAIDGYEQGQNKGNNFQESFEQFEGMGHVMERDSNAYDGITDFEIWISNIISRATLLQKIV